MLALADATKRRIFQDYQYEKETATTMVSLLLTTSLTSQPLSLDRVSTPSHEPNQDEEGRRDGRRVPHEG
jgi:hypothetical protein